MHILHTQKHITKQPVTVCFLYYTVSFTVYTIYYFMKIIIYKKFSNGIKQLGIMSIVK